MGRQWRAAACRSRACPQEGPRRTHGVRQCAGCSLQPTPPGVRFCTCLPLQGRPNVLRILVSSGGTCRGLHLPRGAVPTPGSCAHRQHWWGSLNTYSLGPFRNRECAGCTAASITKDLSLSLAWPFLPNPQAGNRWTGHGLLGFLRTAFSSPVGRPPVARQVAPGDSLLLRKDRGTTGQEAVRKQTKHGHYTVCFLPGTFWIYKAQFHKPLRSDSCLGAGANGPPRDPKTT